ncbi:lysin B [Gordonia phage Forza]|uniref:Lysin B n=1 Tax=Gordonia phage Forza TaxID=2571247 RepID=A0A650EYH8_9CAUD|nr:endolysin [Gordonia phage Forza]QEM41617.1 lysin B [Gordonia phage Boopy]QGT55143.1 lysin B [Gordonia phage Forza]UXE04291.1 lysin B [Gordonia phage BlueNGold]WBF03932.1 lysin B [Gordonia phage Mareelih]
MAREIFFVAGAGEQLDSSQMAYKLCRKWIKRGDIITIIKYNNSIGPVNRTPNPADFTGSLTKSKLDGIIALQRALERTRNVPIIIGYSLGAYVVSDFLERMAAGAYPGLQVGKVLLIASPRAALRATTNVIGIAGPHKPYPRNVQVFELNNINDLICSVTVGSVLTKLPGIVDVLTGEMLDTQEEWAEWWEHQRSTGKLRPPSFRDIMLIQKYMDQTGHVHDYFRDIVLSRFPERVLL